MEILCRSHSEDHLLRLQIRCGQVTARGLHSAISLSLSVPQEVNRIFKHKWKSIYSMRTIQLFWFYFEKTLFFIAICVCQQRASDAGRLELKRPGLWNIYLPRSKVNIVERKLIFSRSSTCWFRRPTQPGFLMLETWIDPQPWSEKTASQKWEEACHQTPQHHKKSDGQAIIQHHRVLLWVCLLVSIALNANIQQWQIVVANGH